MGAKIINTPDGFEFEVLGYNFWSNGLAGEVEEPITVKVLYDRCSNDRGYRRAYARCFNNEHTACFRYIYTKNFISTASMLKFLAAWTVGGMKPGMTKLGVGVHSYYELEAKPLHVKALFLSHCICLAKP